MTTIRKPNCTPNSPTKPRVLHNHTKGTIPPLPIIALGSVTIAAKAGQNAMQAYNEWKMNQPAPREQDEPAGDDSKANSKGYDATASSDLNTGNANETTKGQKG